MIKILGKIALVVAPSVALGILLEIDGWAYYALTGAVAGFIFGEWVFRSNKQKEQ